jgi:hypothetical protein
MTDHFGGFNKMVVRDAARSIRDAGDAATKNPMWQTNFYADYTSAILRAAAKELYFVADCDLMLAIADEIEAQ